MTRVSAILRAAGESRRMGGINKLSLPVAGEPLLRRTAGILMNSSLYEIVVVTGYEQHAARDLLGDLPIRIIHNAHYSEGQMTSVHCGMAALREPCEGVMVCLSDQPLLETGDIEQLVDSFLHRCPTSVLVPTWQDQRGNPIILSSRHCGEILAGRPKLGCRKLIENNPGLVTTLEMNSDHVVFDLDTPADYQRLLQRLEAENNTTVEINPGNPP